MDNDRVRAAGAATGGTGLLGLGERLAGLGGTITARYPGSGRFRLEATVPASGAAATPLDPGQPGTGVIAEKPAP
jgi:two-component system, NarL family, sensor histidine kinase DesK